MLGVMSGGLGLAAAAVRRRLAAWPHWIWPLAVASGFLAVGILVLDDYAVTVDSAFYQRPLAISTLDFALGDADALPADHNKFYGAAFEILPLLVERLAGLDDTRAIYLTRHLMTHLLFIIGGFCCYLLAYRMTGSRLLGLFAMLLFLLHPRMYGHSFFNSKDLPFLSMFMIALFSVHWAFRKGTVMAFVVCGVAVGILVNLRIMGIILLPSVLAMRACDLYFAAGWVERRRVIISGAAFALAAAGIYYAGMPYLWADPLGRFGDLLATLSQHPTRYQFNEIFQGRYVHSANLPALYLPVWIGITSPPWALLLAGLGAVGAAWRTVKQRGAALRNTELRFELLLVGGAALPVVAVIVLHTVMYHDWRQMYFLWAPLCLLAMVGLREVDGRLAALTHRSRWRRNSVLAHCSLAALAALALAAIAAELIRLHPYQHLYFNLLVDRRTPEYLSTQYSMDYYSSGRREGFQYILDNHPGETVQLQQNAKSENIKTFLAAFSELERRRFRYNPETDADYWIINRQRLVPSPPGQPPIIYSRKVYNNAIMIVATPNLSQFAPEVADAYREIYRATVRREPILRTNFDFYINDRTLTLVNENCPPGTLHRAYRLLVYPAGANSLAEWWESHQSNRYLSVYMYGVRFDGKCLMQATLPDYDIAMLGVVGSGVIKVLSESDRAELRRQYAALTDADPVISSEFAVYIGEGELSYAKDECSPANATAPFFLHIIPAEPARLPVRRREYGYNNHDFRLADFVPHINGFVFDDKCMVSVKLPDYEIHGIRTGQYRPGAGRLWSGEFYTDAYYAALASELAAQAVGEPAAQDFYRIHHSADALTYIREHCAPADTETPFYLHLYPVDAADLPEGRRQYGFGNADFEFRPAGGVQYGGRCLVSVPLPDYAIGHIHTGQYSPKTGRLWAAEFAVAVAVGSENGQ